MKLLKAENKENQAGVQQPTRPRRGAGEKHPLPPTTLPAENRFCFCFVFFYSKFRGSPRTRVVKTQAVASVSKVQDKDFFIWRCSKKRYSAVWWKSFTHALVITQKQQGLEELRHFIRDINLQTAMALSLVTAHIYMVVVTSKHTQLQPWRHRDHFAGQTLRILRGGHVNCLDL